MEYQTVKDSDPWELENKGGKPQKTLITVKENPGATCRFPEVRRQIEESLGRPTQ